MPTDRQRKTSSGFDWSKSPPGSNLNTTEDCHACTSWYLHIVPCTALQPNTQQTPFSQLPKPFSDCSRSIPPPWHKPKAASLKGEASAEHCFLLLSLCAKLTLGKVQREQDGKSVSK